MKFRAGFDWPDFYDRAVETAPPGATLVEVGVFCGKSLIYLARKAKAADKGLRVVGVDTFRGSPEFDGKVYFNDRPLSESHPGTLIRETFGVLSNADLLDDVTLIVSDSAKAADLFAVGSAHMVFLDADHDETAVAKDIRAWYSKVRWGGLLGGHDYWTFPGVRAAVDRLVPGVKTDPDRSWWEYQMSPVVG